MKYNNRLRNTGYIIGTLFLIWHSVTLIFSPGPWSQFTSNILTVTKPYSVTLNLHHGWSFYTPDPGYGGVLIRYAIRDSAGILHHNKLIENRPRSDPSYFRYTSYHAALVHSGKQKYFDSLAQYLCRKHQNMPVQSVEFTIIKQVAISPQNYLNGVRPLDDNFVTATKKAPIVCNKL